MHRFKRAISSVSPATLRVARLLAALTLLVGVLACTPQIGDDCINPNECSPGQTCDTAAPGGYCTKYNCLQDGCPGEAVCVDFGERSACMLRCSTNDDCRGGRYRCRADLGPVDFCYVPPAAVSPAPSTPEGSR